MSPFEGPGQHGASRQSAGSSQVTLPTIPISTDLLL